MAHLLNISRRDVVPLVGWYDVFHTVNDVNEPVLDHANVTCPHVLPIWDCLLRLLWIFPVALHQQGSRCADLTEALLVWWGRLARPLAFHVLYENVGDRRGTAGTRHPVQRLRVC